ncbi:ATP-binding protein [Cyclobacterium sp. 1_MG-2023]|uniref:sensor histidine kinase n=1 Tax=Cyclobacterium sp. 1_MG-2023 TaxID=3062681 RepID=UPI0026E361F0|nr:ATP-binding protein [Cyclobacterium sp. 1_MG-2023]MDO6436580.1 ATP-binding protein [Cyclobacterium sp. 1_MG-2023]
MKASLKISLIYIVAGTFWIVWSNNFIEYFFANYSRETIDLIKDLDNILYVLLTGILLYFLIQKQYKYLDDKLKELEKGNQIIEQERLKSDHTRKQLDQFIVVASHDLAGPVRQSQGFLELFIRKNQGKLPQNSIDFLQLTLDNFLKIKTIINDLTMFSQLSDLDKKVELVSLDEVFEKVLHLNSKKITEQQIELKIDPLPNVKGDFKYFIQLFDHLIANAIKFKDISRPLNIEVSATTKDEFCTVEVRDNGRGIPIENIDNVFYILKRYDYGFIKRGTGMGLAICKRITEGLGGQIWADSTIGKGSVFYVKLRV